MGLGGFEAAIFPQGPRAHRPSINAKIKGPGGPAALDTAEHEAARQAAHHLVPN